MFFSKWIFQSKSIFKVFRPNSLFFSTTIVIALDFSFAILEKMGIMQLSTPWTIASPNPSPKKMDFKESLHSPLERGMSDGTLTGVEAPKAACCALKYTDPQKSSDSGVFWISYLIVSAVIVSVIFPFFFSEVRGDLPSTCGTAGKDAKAFGLTSAL